MVSVDVKHHVYLEKGSDADDTLERAQCTVHATDREMQQQRDKAVDGRGRRNWPSRYPDHAPGL